MKGLIRNLNHLYKSGKILPSELTAECLKRIEKTKLNAFITVTGKKAINEAKSKDKSVKEKSDSFLYAVPYSLKDNICTKNIKTTCASKMLSSFVPPYSSPVYDILSSKESVLLGKNNMDEFAMGSTGENSYYGAALNPICKDKVCGGSSSGCAASVSGNISVFSLGSDTGGSVRIPASYCGCVGFKSSYGYISRYGLISYASSLDQIGIISKTVEDVSLVFDAVSFPDKNDSTCVVKKNPSSFSHLGDELRTIKIGFDKSYLNYATDDIKNQFENALKVFENLNCKIVDINLPDIKKVLETYYIIAYSEAASNLARYDSLRYGCRVKEYSSFDDMVTKSRTESFGDEVKKRIFLGNLSLKKGYYEKGYKSKEYIEYYMSEIFKSVDAVILPSVPGNIPYLGAGDKYKDGFCLSDMYTSLANVSKIPALCVPFGKCKNDDPFGLQIMTKKYDDEFLLCIGYKFESETGIEGGDFCCMN